MFLAVLHTCMYMYRLVFAEEDVMPVECDCKL